MSPTHVSTIYLPFCRWQTHANRNTFLTWPKFQNYPRSASARCRAEKKKKNDGKEQARACALPDSPVRSRVNRGHISRGLHHLSANASEKSTICNWSAPICDVTKGTTPPALSRFRSFQNSVHVKDQTKPKLSLAGSYAGGCKQRTKHAAFWKSCSMKACKKAQCEAFKEMN